MSSEPTRVALSVILPVYNAMPWLTVALRDMLKQQLPGGASLEVLAAFDGGDDAEQPGHPEATACSPVSNC